jgi:hypothetical protein
VRRRSEPAIAHSRDSMVAPAQERIMVDESFSSSGNSTVDSESFEEGDSIRSEISHVWSQPSTESTQNKRRRRREARPCKDKRERLSKFMDRIMHQIDANPRSFDFDSISWPPSLAEDAVLRQKKIARLKAHERLRQEESSSADPQTSSQTQDTLILSLQNSIICASQEKLYVPPSCW